MRGARELLWFSSLWLASPAEVGCRQKDSHESKRITARVHITGQSKHYLRLCCNSIPTHKGSKPPWIMNGTESNSQTRGNWMWSSKHPRTSSLKENSPIGPWIRCQCPSASILRKGAWRTGLAALERLPSISEALDMIPGLGRGALKTISHTLVSQIIWARKRQNNYT